MRLDLEIHSVLKNPSLKEVLDLFGAGVQVGQQLVVVTHKRMVQLYKENGLHPKFKTPCVKYTVGVYFFDKRLESELTFTRFEGYLPGSVSKYLLDCSTAIGLL